MKKFSKKVLCIILSVVIVLGSLVTASLASENADGIVIKVSSDKKHYTKGEEIVLDVEVTNTTDEDMSDVDINMDCNWFNFDVEEGSSINIKKLKAGETKNLQFHAKYIRLNLFEFISVMFKRVFAWFCRTLWGANSETTRYSVRVDLIKRTFVFSAEIGGISEDVDNNEDFDYEKDTDNDNLPDKIEEVLGLDSSKDDTDEDGISDYHELTVLGTDPLKKDTDNDGTIDSEDDEDEDGLSNIEEFSLGTYPLVADSDIDGISDGDEINKYNTKPMAYDTDGDTLSDGEEIKLGLDPTKKSTDGVISDDKRTFSQTADDEVKDAALLESENWLNPFISGEVSGDIANNVRLEKSIDSPYVENRSVLSDIIEITTNYDEDITLTFSYNEEYTGDIKNLAIVKVDEENGLQIIETTVDEDVGEIYGDISESATYFVIDVDEFLKGLGIDFFSNLDTPSTFSSRTFASRSIPEDSKATGKADIVFVIDVTGSMSSAIANVKNNINIFAEKLTNDYNIDANFGLVEFQDITCDGLDSTIRHKNMTSNWFTNVNSYKTEIGNLDLGYGGDEPETDIDGIENARRMDWRSDSAKFIVLVTDTYHKNDNRYGISDLDELADLLSADGIITSAITSSSSYYSELTEKTGGLYGYIYGDFYDILLGLADKIGEVTNQGEWVFLDDYQAVRLAPEDADNYGDTDEDDIDDYSELGTKETRSMAPYIALLANRYKVPVELYSGKTSIDVYKYKSNPVLVDTDYDGYLDSADSNPRKWDISDRDLAMAAGISYSYPSIGTQIDTSSISIGKGATAKELKGWKVVDVWHGGAGFYALALKKDKNIIIAYRGSKRIGDYEGIIDTDWIDDWVFADVINVLTGISTQAPAARALAERIVRNYSEYNIYICGHSLGGNLALNASAKALDMKPSIIKRISTFNGLGVPLVKFLNMFSAYDNALLITYADRFYDYEIEGDPVSGFESEIDPKWYEYLGIGDLVLTQGIGHRREFPLKVEGDEHSMDNFYLQLAPHGRPLN